MILKIDPFRDCTDMGNESDTPIIETTQGRLYHRTDGNAKSLRPMLEISNL